MKKFISILVAFLLCFLMVTLLNSPMCQAEGQKFDFEEVWHDSGWSYTTRVFRHVQTNVLYISFHGGWIDGVTALLNPDGTPMLWEEEE